MADNEREVPEDLDEDDLGDGTVTLDDVESRLDEDNDDEDIEPKPKQDLSSVKIDEGTDEIKGRSVAEIVERLKNTETALRISEEARKSSSSRSAPVSEPTPVAEPAEVSDEDIVKLMQEDGVKALQVIRTQLERRLAAHVERRMGPLAGGAVNTAQADAERRYADEFALFGDQIRDYVSKTTDRSVFTDPRQWDNLVSWVRGSPGNFEKLIEHRTKNNASVNARSEQRSMAGHSARPARSVAGGAAAGDDYGLDETEKEIARGMMPGVPAAKAYREYKKWK